MNLEELKKLCDEATPGPWEWRECDGDGPFYVLGGPVTYKSPSVDPNKVLDDGSSSAEYSPSITPDSPDAKFIAAARTALPQLISRLERYEEALKEIQEFMFDENGFLLSDKEANKKQVIIARTALEERDPKGWTDMSLPCPGCGLNTACMCRPPERQSND